MRWHIFSKHTKKSFVEKNCWVRPVNNDDFAESFVSCEGIISGGGFETPAEALYMGKKLLVIPMKNQYEQHCNAAGAKQFGVPVLKSLKNKHADKVKYWLENEQNIKVDFPDETDKIIDLVLAQKKAFKNAAKEKFSGDIIQNPADIFMPKTAL